MKSPNKTKRQSPYATGQDFGRIFSENHDELRQLAFLLSADRSMAEQALVTGIQESVTSNQVFMQWAHSWAKRAVIKNAIRLLKPQPAECESVASSVASKEQRHSKSGDFELARLLALEPFQRFVFVMSALERYSDAECALLLGCSVHEIQNTRVRAANDMFCSTHKHGVKLQVLLPLNDLLDGPSSERRNMLMTEIRLFSTGHEKTTGEFPHARERPQRGSC